MSLIEHTVTILTADDHEKLPNVADIAEVSPGQLMVATTDGDQEMIEGQIFGASGNWKMWHENVGGTVEQFNAEDPLTLPNDTTRFRQERKPELFIQRKRAGRIKRLKRADL